LENSLPKILKLKNLETFLAEHELSLMRTFENVEITDSLATDKFFKRCHFFQKSQNVKFLFHLKSYGTET
jgi:hypothetical protein